MTDRQRVRLLCEAPHPARHKFPRFRGRTHGAELPVTLPDWIVLVPTGRLLRDLGEVADGLVGVRCTHRDCGKVTEFRLDIAPREPEKDVA